MTSFTPSSLQVLAALVAALAAVLGLGLAIVRIPSLPAARAAAWSLGVAAFLVAERITANEPAGVRMLAIIALPLPAMKAVVGVEWRTRLTPLRWLAFAALWPGMRPAIFRTLPSAPRPGAARLVARGMGHLVLGVVLVLLGRGLWGATGSVLATAALVLPGLSFVLHFGLLNVAAGAWRGAGVDAQPLFRAPIRSRSLEEFWGRRWNLAFAEMAALAVYRPVAGMAGRALGVAATFLFSGVLHELAISVPVRAGYGGPLLYFALQGAAMLAEGRLPRGGRPWLGRAWAVAWLVVPLPLLFHAPFLRGVVWPLVGLDW